MKNRQKQFVETVRTFRPSRSSDGLAPAERVGTNHFCLGRSAGFSLVEMLVVTAIVASLIGISIPAINAMQKSYDSTGTLGMVESALSSARAIAISNNKYAGIRFQKLDYGDPENSDQYMIMVVYDENELSNWDCGFISIKGRKPVKLPSNVGVMDKVIVSNRGSIVCGGSITEVALTQANLSNVKDIADTTTFSIIFSPSGKLVIQDMRCGQKSSGDDVFNDKTAVDTAIASSDVLFLVDAYGSDGIGTENSRKEFVLYSVEQLRRLKTATDRWNYIDSLEKYFVNPHTGTIINKN